MLGALVGALLFSSSASSSSSSTHGLSVFPRVFSREECERIVAYFERHRPAQRDVRVHAAVSRTNRFDIEPASGEYDWIYSRLVELFAAHAQTLGATALWGFAPSALRSAAELGRRCDFILLHEFGGGDFFGWHVDTKPADGTARTVNINVMLSSPDDFVGGDLAVGTSGPLRAAQGDVSVYPAALPHRVDDISAGRRHTLVIAVRAADDAERAASGYWALAAANHAALRAALPSEAKLHLVRGEYLVAAGDEDGADEAFADGYAATPEAPAYAERFAEEGERLLAAGDARRALQHLSMAARVDPTTAAYRARRDALAEALTTAESR